MKKLYGTVVPIVTPFDESGKIDGRVYHRERTSMYLSLWDDGRDVSVK